MAPVELTYVEAQALVSNSTVVEGTFYHITDANYTDLGVIVQGLHGGKSFSLQGSAGFLNVDFQNNGNYGDVAALTGIALGNIQTVWTLTLDGSINIGDIVMWNGDHYQRISDDFSGINPDGNSDYQILPKVNTSNYGYIEEWDSVEYIFLTNKIVRRRDKRGNDIATNADGIQNFQWGNNAVTYNIVTIEGEIYNVNYSGSYFDNNFCCGYIEAREASCDITNNSILDNNSQIVCTYASGDGIYENTVSDGSSIEAGDNTGEIGNNNLQNASNITCTTNNGIITGCTFSNGCNTTLNLDGVNMTNCKFITSGHDFSGSLVSYTNKIIAPWISTFDITFGMSSNTATIPDYVGIVNLDSSVVYDVDTIDPTGQTFPITIYPINEAITFTDVDNLIFPTPSTSVTFSGNGLDFITFKWNIANNKFCQIASEQY